MLRLVGLGNGVRARVDVFMHRGRLGAALPGKTDPADRRLARGRRRRHRRANREPAAAEMLGQPVVVENRPGAGGNIGADVVAKAPPDGYTLLLAYTGHVINPGLYAKLPFDTVRDFSPVTMLATNQTVLVVHPSVPAKTVKELIALARAKPGKFTVGSLPGSSQHLAGELFKSMAKLDLLFIPYKGNSQALTGLMSGEVDVMFNTMTIVQPHVRSGKMRALAVTGKSRSQLMPEVRRSRGGVTRVFVRRLVRDNRARENT